jgi:protein-L-isoaspartate(D-aspartate) O-methyltransferase
VVSGPEELRRRYVDILYGDGVLHRDDLAAAFGAVPREAFVADGFYDRTGRWVTPDDSRFLEMAYSNDALITKIVDGVPVSSSSQPSLMAVMIEALDPAPGMRVLEIGAGTGYNAALMAAMGVRVTSVDAQPDVVARAAAALQRAGAAGVEVRAADGYQGDPSGAG